MQAGVAIDQLLPLVIAAMMFGIGLSLALRDFTAVLRAPLAAAFGLAAMFLAFPALAFGLAAVLDLAPELKVGLVMLAASPSASTSTLFTYLARGDAALSLTLTSVSRTVPVLTIPVWVSLAAASFGQAETTLELDYADISEQLALVALLPTLAGMALRQARPGWAERWRPRVMRASVLSLVLLILFVVYRERSTLPGMVLETGPAVVALCLGGMLLAYAGSGLLRLGERQRSAITLELGMQSGGTTIAIASLLGAPAMAVPAAVYSLFMYPTAAAFVAWRLRSAGRS